MVDGIFGGVGTREGTAFVDVLVLVFGPGTTAVEAMPDSAMVKRALGAQANVAGPCDEGEESAGGVFSSSGVVSPVVSVVAGTGNMDMEMGRRRPAASALFRKDCFGWVAAMPR